MQERSNKIKGQLFKVGFFLLIVGGIVFFSIPLLKIKDQVFEEMRLAIFRLDINSDNTTINNVNTENLDVTVSEPSTDNTTEEQSSPNYSYIGELSIPDIRFQRGFVAKESKYNNINYNITIVEEADYPDVSNGNFILMAHSGNAYISFFDKLYQLQIGALANVSYNAVTYTYKLVKVYTQAKTGKVAIYRNPNVKTLTLITCTHNDDYNQSIYIFEEV